MPTGSCRLDAICTAHYALGTETQLYGRDVVGGGDGGDNGARGGYGKEGNGSRDEEEAEQGIGWQVRGGDGMGARVGQGRWARGGR